MAKILVVDDEPDMVWALTNVLLSENHTVISANSGEEALEKVRGESPDMVLLDFRLPGMDGVQILQKIKSINASLPVIMVSGYGGIEEAVQAMKLGAADYLPKPFENKQLVELVNKSLQLNTLKKEGVFGKMIAQKVEPKNIRHQELERPAGPKITPANKFLPSTKLAQFLLPLFLFLIAGIGFISYRYYQTMREQAYDIINSRVSGITIGNEYLWTCDWYSQVVSQYKLKNNQLMQIRTFTLPNSHLTGITRAEGFLYTCDSWKREISKHSVSESLPVVERAPSPGPNPSGLFYDGNHLWSCDGTTRKIYQHSLDPQLSVIAAYDSFALFPVALYHDGKQFWCADSKGKILVYSMQEGLKLEKTFVMPKSLEIAKELSAFTIKNEKVWAAYEGINKIFRFNLKNLLESSE